METAQVKQEKAKVKKTLQVRFGELEATARDRLQKALDAGQHRLTELDVALSKVSRDDWTVDGMRKRLEGLRKQAETIRSAALKRVNELPGTAVTALATSTRGPVQNLARELERLAKAVEARVPEISQAKDVEVIPPEPKPARSKAKVEV